ncbi:hypothetical protein HNP82_000686 [Catenibacillus scindens]|uniref:Uncharacterized protein n=1 Tax=Catenibacillus scindens TaxID=673271 RepID=A0A7W8M3Z3_9FIRM|nr:SDR family NAD(P)-dependent oxidoreductase [Catenibacillus scindens]MBB5263588.1 hypothetical protein [Catenibacillus scindens]
MKIAVVTGASSGLGREFVYRLIKEKDLDEIWMIARRKEKMDEIAASEKSRARLRSISLDLSKESGIDHYSQLLEKHRPRVAWLINCAGFGKMGANAQIGREALDAMVMLNCKGAMDMTQVTIPYMERGSHILEICSTAAFMPLGGLGVYAATKAFLLSYSRSLYYELFPKKIFVTAVCPYWIKDTEFIPVARGENNFSGVRHFPLASRSRSVARWAMADAKLMFSVSTPGIACTLHRLVAKFIPRDLLMVAWEGLRRI